MNVESVFRFGNFELNPASRSLTRGEEKLILNRRAFDVLCVLVEHRGEVLSREQLIKIIWNDSFVDENSLSQSISALRRALAERPGENNYIATLPGRGYQFLAPVFEVPTKPLESATMTGVGVLMQEHTTTTRVVVEEITQGAPNVSGRSAARTIRVAAIVALVAVAGSAWLWSRHRLPQQPGPYRHIVLADFVNTTGDPAFDLSLRKALEIDLAQSPYMDVLGSRDIANTLQFMGKPADTPLTAEISREVCERTNNDVLLSGTVSALGQQYLITVEATDCSSGKIMAVAKAEARSREGVIDALDSVTAEIRKGLNESARSLQEHDVPLREVTTSSLDALKAYSAGQMLAEQGRPHAERIAAYQRAVDVDPQFALAYRALGGENTYIGQDRIAAQYFSKAFELSQHVSTREQLLIQASYHQYAEGDIPAAIKSWKLLSATYPQDASAMVDAMDGYMLLGQHPLALAEGTDGVARFPNAVVLYENLATTYMNLNRFPEALQAAIKAEQVGRGDTGLHIHLFLFALAQRDQASILHEDQWFESQETGATVWYYPSMRGAGEATSGKLSVAEPLFERAYESALRAGAAEAAESVLSAKAETEMNLGYADKARATLRRIKQPATHELHLLLLQTRLGDASAAERFLAALGEPTSDTLRTYVAVPELRAAVALHNREPQRAIEVLAQSTPYEMRDYVVLSLRAEAHLQARHAAEAAAEYQKILANPGVDPLSVLYPLAHLGLARAFEMQGNHDASQREYKTLLALWKNADPNLPVLQQAEAENARIALK